MNPLGKNRIQKEYSRRRDLLDRAFPAAYGFLRQLEEQESAGLWLSTCVNAHIYKDRSYVAYMLLEDRRGAITLSPRPNHGIWSGTRNESDRLFPERLRQLIAAHEGFNHGWARVDGEDFEIRIGATQEFFNALVETLAGLPVCQGPPHTAEQQQVLKGETAMGHRFLGGRTWAEITREERFFCARLYELIRDGGPEVFVQLVNKECGTSLPVNAGWEPAFEACFYRDLWNHRGCHGKPFSLKRTFDLCLLSDEAILIVEAKAHEAFQADQLESFSKDHEQISKETGVKQVVLIGLASSQYSPPVSVRSVFDGPLLTWKALAAFYRNDPILGRAEALFNPNQPQTWQKHNDGGYMTGQDLLAAFDRGEEFWVGRNKGLSGCALSNDIASGRWRTHRYETNRTSSIPPSQNWFKLSDFANRVRTSGGQE